MSIRFYLPGAEDAFLRPLQKREAPRIFRAKRKSPFLPEAPKKFRPREIGESGQRERLFPPSI
jgi:hypothetical protein